MPKSLRILHLEDDPDFSEMVACQLQQDQVDAELTLVSTRAGFESALREDGIDLVIADYLLPDFDGLQALAIVRERCPRLPFLMVSGAINENAAVESLRCGATDYVLKHRLERLIPAIVRAGKEADEKAKLEAAETQLIRRENYFRSLTDHSLDVISILDQNGLFIYNSPSLENIVGYAPAAVKGLCAFSLVHPEDLAAVVQAFETGLQDPELTLRVSFRFRHRNGSWRYIEAIGKNRLGEPEIGGVVLNARDVTDRKEAEDNLRQSEEQYRLIFDGNPIPMFVFDHQTQAILEVNDAAVQHYGYSRDQFLGMGLRDLRPEGETPAMIEYVHRLVPDECPGFSGIWQHRKQDGSLIEVEMKWSSTQFRGRAASLVMATDVTERRRMEHRNAALCKLGQNLNSTMSPAGAADTIRMVADELFHWDVFVFNLYSVEADEITPVVQVDTNRSGVRVQIDLAQMECHTPSPLARRVIENGAELIRRTEPLRHSEDSLPIGDVSRPSASLMFVPIRNRTRVIGILSIQSYTVNAYDDSDLATLQMLADHCGGAIERIKAEQALRDSERQFRDLFEGSPDAVFVEDAQGKVLDVNPAACVLHQCTREDLVGSDVTQLVPEELRESVRRQFPALLEGNVSQIEGVSLARNGQPVPVEVRVNRIEYAGQPALLLHVRDITERKRAEDALRSSELLFHSVWANSVDGMRICDQDGMIVAVNEAYCRLVAKTRAELEGQPFTVVYDASEKPLESMERFRRRFSERTIDRQVEVRLMLHNGMVVTLEDTNSFVDLRGGPPLLLSLFRNVSDQRQLEEQLRQAQKMEAIGQLAGGVAHDFNNVLTVIHGHASLLLATGAVNGLAARSAQQVIQAAERAAGLTRQLLAFGRRQIMQPRLLDMNELVCNMTKMLGRLLGEDVALHLNYSPVPARVRADAGMIEQVLLNLAVNSRDAMPQGGVLRLRVAVVDANEGQVASHPEAHAGRYVCLTADDTGCGIAPENLRRIFEPFFTTKEVGKGTGLGLATVYGIVRQHQGWIEVDSKLGKGTTFCIYLPLEMGVQEAADSPELAQPVKGGKETILVVEDEAPVRELVCQLLAAHGYQILHAESGAKALELWQNCKDKVDLVLTDMVMPDRINGRELAERLWAERPDLKVIFTSGYSAEVVGRDFVLRRGLNYLQKPYHPDKLAGTVRDCLDAVN